MINGRTEQPRAAQPNVIDEVEGFC